MDLETKSTVYGKLGIGLEDSGDVETFVAFSEHSKAKELENMGTNVDQSIVNSEVIKMSKLLQS